MSAITKIAPGFRVFVEATGAINFIEGDLAEVACLTPRDFATRAGPRGREAIEIDGVMTPVRRSAWVLDLAMREDRDLNAMRLLWVEARKLLRVLIETGLRERIAAAHRGDK